MFGTNGEETLTLLNSEYEQYKVPANWCWANIGAVTNIYRGVSYKKNDEHHEKKNNDCLVMRGGNVQEGRIDLGNDNVYVDRSLVTDKQLVRENDIIIVSSTGSTRVIGRAGISFSDYSDVTFGVFLTLVRPSEHVNKRYVAYYFQSDVYRNRIRQLACGVNINNIRNEYITETPIPLPPLSEQNRIVKKIESLFTKLDEAKEKAQEIIDSSDMRKASILHKAFTGELTTEWRKENGITGNAYSKCRFDEVAEIKSNLVNPADYPNYPHIAPDNIEKKTGVLLDYHTIEEDGVKSGKHLFYPGQILYSKIRPNLSKVVVVDFKGLCSADMYPIKAKGDAKCLWYYMLSEEFLEQASSAGSRSVLPKINQKELSRLRVSFPASIDEQKEISRILDTLLERELQTKKTAEMVIDQIDIMKKSILSKAFRGELKTNNPNDESAKTLLIEILSEKTTKKEKQQKIKQERIILPKEIEAQINTELEKKIIKLLLKSNTKEASVNEIMSISSKTFDILDAIRTLENKQLIKELKNKQYKLLR